MHLFATAFPSDGKFSETWYHLNFWLWIAASIGALASVVLWLMPQLRKKLVPVIATTAIAVAIYPIAFGSYLHHIDFVEIAQDGTPASPPYWKALGLAWIPILLALPPLFHSAISRRRTIHDG